MRLIRIGDWDKVWIACIRGSHHVTGQDPHARRTSKHEVPAASASSHEVVAGLVDEPSQEFMPVFCRPNLSIAYFEVVGRGWGEVYSLSCMAVVVCP